MRTAFGVRAFTDGDKRDAKFNPSISIREELITLRSDSAQYDNGPGEGSCLGALEDDLMLCG